MLLLALACTPKAGTYLVETEEWSTTCSVGGGPYEEPAAQYEVEVYVEEEGVLWLDDVPCTRVDLDYACADEPVLQAAGTAATLRVTRSWTGAWRDALHFDGHVAWETRCSGDGCADVALELCDAAWSFTGVNVEGAG